MLGLWLLLNDAATVMILVRIAVTDRRYSCYSEDRQPKCGWVCLSKEGRTVRDFNR